MCLGKGYFPLYCFSIKGNAQTKIVAWLSASQAIPGSNIHSYVQPTFMGSLSPFFPLPLYPDDLRPPFLRLPVACTIGRCPQDGELGVT